MQFGGRKHTPDADSLDLLKTTYTLAGLCKPVLEGLQEAVINAVLKDESPCSILQFDGWTLILDRAASCNSLCFAFTTQQCPHGQSPGLGEKTWGETRPRT